MSDQGFKKQRDLKLHCQKYHPPPKVPELVLDPPSLDHDSPSDILTELAIVYAPDLESSFTVDLLFEFVSESVCSCVAISGDERYVAVGRNRKIYICSLVTLKEVMRYEVNAPGPVQLDSYDYVRDLSFTRGSECLIGATESGRILVCCQASTSWLETLEGRKSYLC